MPKLSPRSGLRLGGLESAYGVMTSWWPEVDDILTCLRVESTRLNRRQVQRLLELSAGRQLLKERIALMY